MERQIRPLGDGILLSEIAAALENIGRIMTSDGTPELFGFNATWFLDAADFVTNADNALDSQWAKIEALLDKLLADEDIAAEFEGHVTYPSETGGWLVGDVDLEAYMEQYQDQSVKIIIIKQD